jgi:uncharacterized protein YprB with RNaseH-like and TPR domain
VLNTLSTTFCRLLDALNTLSATLQTDMLQNTFLFLDGIGPQRERTLWANGVVCWEDFIDRSKIKGISREKKSVLDSELSSAGESYRQSDSAYFAQRLPSREQWRCLTDFHQSALFLDIETTGISPRSPITMIGAYDGSRMHTMIRGQNLTRSNIEGLLSGAKIIVTFNGSSFDLPMIESQFPGTVPRIPHVDLKHPLRRIGLTGGLKRIERELGVERDRRVEYMTGEDAVYLWRLWEKDGNRNALELLSEYNAEDCRNLKILADYAYRHLRRQVFETTRASWKG